MRDFQFITYENNVNMNRNSFSESPFTRFEIHQVNSPGKIRLYDSPLSSILKTPTAIFVTTRSSSAKTKKLKFANGPVDLQTLKNGSNSFNVTPDSNSRKSEDRNLSSNGDIVLDDSLVEVAISPVKKMQVSQESWKAFLEYKKFNDYPNETEKTDYTYSRMSKFRHKEIIPGFLIRPNLSRSPIYSSRSSISSPSSLTSFSESYRSGYDIDVHNPSSSNISYDFSISSPSNKGSRYYLRSSSFDDASTRGVNEKSVSEYDFYNNSVPDVYTESVTYSTSGKPHSTAEKSVNTMSYTGLENPELCSRHYGKLREMDLDDADIDEVDDNSLQYKKHYHSNAGALQRSHSVFDYFTNFFTTIFLYVTSVATFSKGLFTKYILRRQDDFIQPSSSYPRYGQYEYATAGGSWIPWTDKNRYSSSFYSSGKYFGAPRSWYQRLFDYIYDKTSMITNLIWGNSVGYASSRYYRTSERRRFWWFLIPFLLLAGSFLGYIDFFSNPKAILNTMYNWLFFVPSFLYYTVMVFIPRLIFEVVPYLILTAIPNFIIVTLPYFFTNTMPYYFWVIAQFFASLSILSIWNMLLGAFSTLYSFTSYIITASGEFLYQTALTSFSSGFFLYKAEQENGFISNQYKNLDCKTNGLLTSMENTIKPVWRLGYITYKRAAVAASCYVNDSWERLKLPFTHINEWLCSKLSVLSENSLSWIFSVWNTFYRGLYNVFSLFHDAFTNTFLLLLNFFTDFISAVGNVLHYICRYFMDVFFAFAEGFLWIVGNIWQILLSGLHDAKSFVHTPRVKKYQEVEPLDTPREACAMQQKSIEKLTSDIEDFKSTAWDLSLIKKKIDELELEFRREKESRKNKNEMYDKQLEENHKTLQKYQATVNHALYSPKRPNHVSSSSIQYFLDNQSDALKQWITSNFLLKSESGFDGNELGSLIAKHTNQTEEEVRTLKKEFEQFVRSHRNELESMRNDLNVVEGNNLGGGDISIAYIKKLIAEAIKLYDADKTGRVDYALETAGGHVQSIRCTETYIASPKSYVLMGWSVYTKTSSPRDAISPGMAAGQCWAFVGSQGFLVLQLSHTIRVTGFTMEHISRLLVPKGHIESAPKNFSMWGLKSEHDEDPFLFGEYTYLDNEETIQYFPVVYPTSQMYKLVELKITSNHGNPDYTCLYRIRVHGELT